MNTINFGYLKYHGNSAPYPLVLYSKVNRNGQAQEGLKLKLEVTYKVFASEDTNESVFGDESKKHLTINCPKLDEPCEDSILDKIIPSGSSQQYKVKVFKIELLNTAQTGKLNEQVYINLGIAEFNQGYLKTFKNLKLYNLFATVLLFILALSCISSNMKSQIKKLGFLLLVQHLPIVFNNLQTFTRFHIVYKVSSCLFYTYLLYFWMDQLHSVAHAVVNNKYVVYGKGIITKILSLVRQIV